MSDCVTDNVGGGGGSREETSANPRHRVFLTHGVRNYETYTVHASHLGKIVWENYALEMGGNKTMGRQEIFLGKMRRENAEIDGYIFTVHILKWQ